MTVRHGTTTTVAEADSIIMATGIFSRPTLPKIPGILDYEGHICHSSRWSSDFDPAGKNIAVIGNGASGLQILPQLQKVSHRIDHYVRSPTWIANNFGGQEREKPIPQDLKSPFGDPDAYLRYRKSLENPSFSSFGNVMKDSAKSKQSRANIHEIMKARLGGRTDLLAAIEPDFSPSCRRLTPGPWYLEALTQSNVEYITTGIERFTKSGIKTVDGKERDVDAIICCTGSEKTFSPPFPIVNRRIDLASA